MTSPSDSKQVRLSAEAHAALMALAAQLRGGRGTADDAVRHLIGLSTVRIPVTETQHRRWKAAAQAIGVSVDEFVKGRIEACLQFGTDGLAIHEIWQGVDALCRNAGIGRQTVNRRPSTSGPQTAPARRQLSTPHQPEA